MLVNRLIKLDGDSYTVEFDGKGWLKVSKNSNELPTIEETILVLREYAAGKGELLA
jgi:hypothetical protein